MGRNVKKSPGADAPPGEVKALTTPPMLGSVESWRRVEGDVNALAADAVQRPRVDLQVAAENALSVCDAVADDPALTARLAALSGAGEFSVDGVGALRRYAAAAWFARRMQRSAESNASEVSAPPELIAAGEAIVRRMALVCGYHLASDASVSTLVATVNGARGHRRLANHLLNLADVYQTHRAALAKDTVHYRAADEGEARKVASEIIVALADRSADGVEVWGDRCARIWTLLSASYAELQCVGQFLLRKTPEAAKARFPSLVAESRATPKPRKAAAPAQPAQPADGAPATPAPPADAATPRAAAAAPKRKRRSR